MAEKTRNHILHGIYALARVHEVAGEGFYWSRGVFAPYKGEDEGEDGVERTKGKKEYGKVQST